MPIRLKPLFLLLTLILILVLYLTTHHYQSTNLFFPDTQTDFLTPVQFTDEDFNKQIENHMQQLPRPFFDGRWSHHTNRSCARYPDLMSISYDSIYWQSQTTSNGTFKLYGAYFDNRQNYKEGPSVRILGVYDRVEPTLRVHCQLWYSGQNEPTVVKAEKFTYIWHLKWGNAVQGEDQPYLITCPVPKSRADSPPDSVSLVEHPCNHAINNLRVFYNKPYRKKGFAVCVKGLDFPHQDLSVRLAEWIELLNILGAEKIFFYNLQVHPNISRLLNYYHDMGKVDVTPHGLPGPKPNFPPLRHLYMKTQITRRRQMEVIPYNDCLYKHMYEYDFLVLLDTDEVIVPTVGTWKDMMRGVFAAHDRCMSYCARNAYFLDEFVKTRGYLEGVPKYMHMLQHVYRTGNYTKPSYYTKCLHDTENMVVLHNHYALETLSKYTHWEIPMELGHLQHYRADCVSDLKKTCLDLKKNVVVDNRVWRFADELVGRVGKVLKDLGYIGTRAGD